MELIEPVGWVRLGLRWLGATAVTVLLTALLLLLHVNASTSGIAYLVLVVWFATLAGRAVSIYLAVAASLLFDFYFLDPLYSIQLYGSQEWISLTAFIGSCIVVSRVAERARRETRVAERRRADTERLYSLSQEMMIHEDAAGLVREVPRLVERNFALHAVLLYVRDEDQLYSSIPGGSDRGDADGRALDGGGGSVAADEMGVALRELSAAVEPEVELPGGYSHINLVFGMSSVGTLAWRPATLSREVATSIAAQVAIAITRAHAIEASTRMEAARSADRLRTALIDSLTHELRTPLTAIRAAASTLVSPAMDGYGLDEETRRELAMVVDEESSRLDSLIGEAMEIAEIESDGIRVKPQRVYPGTFLEQAVEESRDQLGGRQVTISVQEPDGPAWFDPHLIGRVLRHLLENAARYTPANSRVVLRSTRLPGKLEFSVEDNGPGIDAYDLPLIFEKFYRGRKRLSAAKGSGMGLAITRALLAAHGGAIDVESTLGRGTTFRLWVPLVEKAVAANLD